MMNSKETQRRKNIDNCPLLNFIALGSLSLKMLLHQRIARWLRVFPKSIEYLFGLRPPAVVSLGFLYLCDSEFIELHSLLQMIINASKRDLGKDDAIGLIDVIAISGTHDSQNLDDVVSNL